MAGLTRFYKHDLLYLEVFEPPVKEQVFPPCQGFPQQVMLRADTHHGVDAGHVCAYILPFYQCRACTETQLMILVQS